jgi:hypothetical protein
VVQSVRQLVRERANKLGEKRMSDLAGEVESI